MKLGLLSIFAISALFFYSCSSIKQPDSVYETPDFTMEDVKKEEIKRIEALLDKNSVQALWRATLVKDSDIQAKCFDAVVTEFKKEISNKNWFAALRLHKSLAAVGYEGVGNLSKSRKELESLCLENVPGVKMKSSSSSDKVSSYIAGTVTVWVDRGIRIHNGMGYADRVIGSGFFISENGYIITNHHVIADLVDPKTEGYSRLYIKLAADSDTRIPAKVVGWDPVLDLALLKAEVDAAYVFSLGSSEDLDVGDKIYAIGSPVGLERTLTSGIVSATGRKLFTLGSVMQIDAAVNSGNSGGPCIDRNGNVQAIVFAGMLQYEGLNFAIPVEYLKSELPALYSGGKVEHSWIASYGHTKKEEGKDVGLEVQYVMPGGSAHRAGISVGDVIIAADGQPVNTLEDMQNILIRNAARGIILVKYKNANNEEKECSVYLASRPENPGYVIYSSDIIANSFVPIYGMKLVATSTTSKKKYSIEQIISGSVADESGFSENDPVDIRTIKFDDEKTSVYAEIYAKNRKKGYLDVSMAVVAALDSPYYF